MSAQRASRYLVVMLLLCSALGGGAAMAMTARAARAEKPALAAQAQTIDPTEVADLVARQASYQVSLSMQTGATTTDWEITVVREPASQYIRDVTGSAPVSHYIKIGEREWIGLGADPAWRSSDDPNLTQGEREGLARIQGFVPFPLFFNIEGPQASLTNPGLDVDGTTCDEYVRAEGETTLSICLSPDSGLPVRATLGGSDAWIEAHYSHFNAPANAIAAPTADFPERLHAADARMALNSLASFQWAATARWQPNTGTDTGGYRYRGTYVQATQGWRAALWPIEADTDGPPTWELLSIGEDQWLDFGDGESRRWVPLWIASGLSGESLDFLFELADPLYLWRNLVLLDRAGDLAAGDANTFDGRTCNEYLIVGDAASDQGQALHLENRLWAAVDSALPMRVEVTGVTPEGTLTWTWELSHIDDPGNQVEPPG